MWWLLGLAFFVGRGTVTSPCAPAAPCAPPQEVVQFHAPSAPAVPAVPCPPGRDNADRTWCLNAKGGHNTMAPAPEKPEVPEETLWCK